MFGTSEKYTPLVKEILLYSVKQQIDELREICVSLIVLRLSEKSLELGM
jgi:hypothetical protein